MSIVMDTKSFPAVDDHIVEAETDTREEMVRGERVVLLGPETHGQRLSVLTSAIWSHVAAGYVPSTDLLTRFSEDSDFATNLSVRRAGKDELGHRHLEELTFDIVFTQMRDHMTIRADEMSHRGVRRVFAIFVDEDQCIPENATFTENATLEEWSACEGRWQVLDIDGVLTDPTLVRPLRLLALFDTDIARDELVRAAEVKGSPHIRQIEARRLAGKRESIEWTCSVLGITVTPEQHQCLLDLDEAQLETLLRNLVTERRWSV